MDETARIYAGEIGYNIKHYREEASITQQKLADIISSQTTYRLIDEQNSTRKKQITRDSIAKYESGTVLPPIDNIAAIAKALDVSFWSLMPLKFRNAVRETADNALELFSLMMDDLNCLWAYDKSMEKVLVISQDQDIKGHIMASDIVALSNKTQAFYKAELLKILKNMNATDKD